MEYIGYFASIIIGLSLGLIGGGGSILTIPILVYLFKIDPELATSYSLFIVGITSLSGCISHYRMGNLQIKAALYFAVPSIFSILIIREVIFPQIAETLFSIASYQVSKSFLIMIVFSLLMMAASISMIRKSKEVTTTGKTNYVQLGVIGFFVGIVTGFLGAGGGFLYPKTNTKLLGKERYDEFHVSGYGFSAKAGLNITFLKYFFIQGELKGGYINMKDIRTTQDKADRAEQDFWFFQRILVIGGIFRI